MTDLLTTKEVAEILNLTAGRVRQLAQRGLLHGRHVGRDWVFERDHVRQFAAMPRRKSGRPAKLNLLDVAIQEGDKWRHLAGSQHAVIEWLKERGLPPGVSLMSRDGWYIGIIEEQP